MLNRYMEYRETRQLRKDHLAKQRLRQLSIFMGIFGALLAVMVVVTAVMPIEPAQSVAPVKTVQAESTPVSADQQEIQEIEDFAVMVTKPVDELDQDDLALLNAKASDPCYAKHALLPPEQMVEKIAACKHLN